jgi:hypothetical protein
VFFYRPNSGLAVAGGFGRDGQFRQLNGWGDNELLAGWTDIVGIDS